MVPQHIIDEARARGIVPGETCRSPYGTEWTVGPISNWDFENGNGLYDTTHTCNPFIHCQTDGWATVITPAPQADPEGLVEGDACECGPAMRAAIIELAKELGLETFTDTSTDDQYPNLHFTGITITGIVRKDCVIRKDRTWHTPEAFIAKMRVEAAKPKPIRIGEHEVKFNAGSIKVGCTTIDNATVRAIAANLKD